jgi:hypothetical protein
MVLQKERAGVEIEVPADELAEAVKRADAGSPQA